MCTLEFLGFIFDRLDFFVEHIAIFVNGFNRFDRFNRFGLRTLQSGNACIELIKFCLLNATFDFEICLVEFARLTAEQQLFGCKLRVLCLTAFFFGKTLGFYRNLYVLAVLFHCFTSFFRIYSAKMPVFDAVNTAFATAGTGGFGFKNDSFASHSPIIQVVVTVFMLIFSVNFGSYYLLFKGKIKEALNLEFRVFCYIVFSAIAIISVNLILTDTITDVADSVRHTAFSVASVISTTGFSTENFDLWPTLSKVILVMLMFVGACAGSTGGGIKVSRIIILIKGVIREFRYALHPRQVKKITIDKKPIDDEVVRSVNSYIVCYIVVFAASIFVLSLEGHDLVTTFTSVVSTINNIGPGLAKVGPAGNFAFFSTPSKLVLIFDMLAGRLELLPMLLLFHPATWKK